jgi:hypothetical protein
MKLLIIGHMRSGKDEMADILNKEFGLKYIVSSQAAAKLFIYKELKDKYGYKTPTECFNDRVNHRPEWYNLICDYNKDDKCRLAKAIMEISQCYVGMRDLDEINECRSNGLFDLIIWVDASGRVPDEPKESFNINKSCADIIITNNGTLDEFKTKVIRLGQILFN